MGQMDWAKPWTIGLTPIPRTPKQEADIQLANECRPVAQRAWNAALRSGNDAEVAYNAAWEAHEAEVRAAALAYLKEKAKRKIQ